MGRDEYGFEPNVAVERVLSGFFFLNQLEYALGGTEAWLR
ncbi:hypothetical protein B4109_0204 [Geobacillus stearothermophilus]|uniref:Uncharacterized protein n=1 Tax=Geobacillus stearothermophilus TaxID=1422 RepID=A0A150MD60_GEOSE|nr:hypothetical protein B4109_0204 [Geobacillus stearothermophilus]